MPDFFKYLTLSANWIKRRNRIRRATLRARLLRRPAIALAALPQTSPSQRNFPPGRLLLPAPMPGDCFDRPAFSPAHPGSVAAIAPTAFHWGSSWSLAASLPTSKCAPPSKPSAAPVTEKSASGSKNSVLPRNRKLPPRSLCNGDARWPLPSIPPRPIARQHSASHPRSFQMLPINYVRFDQHSLPRLRRARRPRRSLCHRKSSRLPHSTLRCRTQKCRPPTRRHAPTAPARRSEFGPMNDLAEMARITSSYTARLSPEQVRLSRIGRFIWLRLDVRSTVRTHLRFGGPLQTRSLTTNLVFSLSANSPRPIPFAHPERTPASPQIP
jgi:hypothetical protein